MAKGQPAVFTQSGTLASVTGTGQSILQLAPMGVGTPSARQCYALEELRFTLATAPTAVVSVVPFPYAYVLASIAAGRRSLTNGFVPVSVLNPRVYGMSELAITQPGAPLTYITTGYVKWKFDTPLALDIGEAITVALQSNVPAATGTMPALTCYVSAACRAINEMPPKVTVPYAAGYIGQPTLANSLENDLRNMLRSDLHVRRFVGRSFDLGSGNFWADESSAQSASFNSLTNYLKIDQLMPDWISFEQVFPQDRLSFDAQFVLRPGQSIGLQWQQQLAANWIPMVGMIGEHEEVR